MTGSDLVVVPGTGELLALDTIDHAGLVLLRAQLADLAAQLATARTSVNLEITRRIDQENREGGTGYTWRIAGYKVSVTSPAALGKLNDEAMRHDLITDRVDVDVDALFTRKTSYTLKADRWRNLVKQRPDLDDYRKSNTRPPRRDVSIVPLPGLIQSTADDA